LLANKKQKNKKKNIAKLRSKLNKNKIKTNNNIV